MLLLSTLTLPFVAIETANAHTPPWQYTTYAYINASPNPIGVGQQVMIFVWLDYAMPGALLTNDIRFHDYSLTITKPDNTIAQFSWPVVTDSTSSQWTFYTPDQPGTYTLLFKYPGQTYTWSGVNQNDTFSASSASMQLVVQQQKIEKMPYTPLPTEYWTRPINGINTLWDSVSSNWLGGAATSNIWQKDGVAPRSAHIMWTKQLELGGLVGGAGVVDQTYYSGFSYNTRFGSPLIVAGTLYYTKPLGQSGNAGGQGAVDLRTGEDVWSSDTISFGKAQTYDYQSPNQHGTVGAILWQTSGTTWIGYNAFDRKWIMNLTGVPSGTEVYAPDGSIVRYVLNYNATKGSGWLALWNNTEAIVHSAQLYGGDAWPSPGAVINASGPSAYSWNVTISANLKGSSNPSIVGIIPGDLILGSSSSIGLTSQPNPNPNPWTMWALNLDPSRGLVGNLLWIQNYPAPSGNRTRMLAWQPMDPVTREWTMTDFETGQRLAYSLDTGNLVWGPLGTQPGFQYYSSREGLPAYGNLYVTGYGGVVQCYSMTNGTLLWTYGNGGAGNSTSSGDETPWGNYPIHAGAFADGVFYTFPGEHSPNTPLYKGERIRAVDAFTGEELWTLLGWAASGLGTSVAPIAISDGYLVFANAYDGQIYSIGKGPSATTVTAPDVAVTQGSSIVIRGTVTDQSPGSKAKGTAAISDDNMTAWMEYMFEQQPRPNNVIGVEVTLDAIDPNNNRIPIGTATSDASGLFSFLWQTPAVPGKYTVIATFAGSNSYWPSYAETAVGVVAPPSAAPTQTPTPVPPTPTPTATTVPTATPTAAPNPTGGLTVETYIAIGAVVIIVVAAAAALILRRRK